MLDSGSSFHLCNDRRLFRKIRRAPSHSIVGFSGELTAAHEIGEIALELHDGSTLMLSNVYFSPKFQWTLVSVPQLTADGYHTAFEEKRALLTKGGAIVCEVPRRDHKYLFDLFLPE